MKLRVIKFIVLMVFAALIWWAWLWIQGGSEAEGSGSPGGGGQPAPVTVAAVELHEFTTRIDAVGTVRSDESIDVSANVTETVEKLLFEDGDVATNGQVLALLSADEELATLAAAQAGFDDHQREVNRLTDLVKQGAASEIRLQERQSLATVAEQQILEAKAKLQNRRIVAPFSGLLGLRRISVGALVTPGTVITTLDKIGRVKLDFTVPEIFISELRPGLRITARSAAYPEQAFDGVVAYLDSRVNPVTRAITVRAIFDNPNFRLKSGMLLTTTLEGSPRTSPSLPERALISNAQNHYAFVLVGTGDALTVERRKVELGRRIMGYVEALSGIAEGERVVADGLLGLKNGSQVVVIGAFAGPVKPFQPTEGDSSSPESDKPAKP